MSGSDLEDAGMRRTGRVACGAVVRFAGAALILGALFLAAEMPIAYLELRPWFPFRMDLWKYFLMPHFTVELLIAVGLGALRVGEAFASRLRPRESYARTLALGGIVGAMVVVASSLFLFQLHYAAGLIETGTVAGGLQGVARGEWFTDVAGASYLARHVSVEGILGFALPFAVLAVLRARGISRGRQVALLAFVAFMMCGQNIAYRVNADFKLGLFGWIVAAVSYAILPLLAALGDRLEVRFMPLGLREPAMQSPHGT